jgi:VanZ family protein
LCQLFTFAFFTMQSFIKYNFASLGWALTIFIACLLPGEDVPHFILNVWDKALHLLIYAILSMLTYYGWIKQNSYPRLRANTVYKIVFATAFYGFFVEICQHLFTRYRYFDWVDALANAMGAIIGCLLCLLVNYLLAARRL